MTIEQSIGAVEIVALETDPPLLLDEATPVREVLQEMRERHAGCALLTREGKLSGIFTECYGFFQVFGVDGALDDPISRWMTPDPIAIRNDEPIRAALCQMSGGYRNVPVVDSEGCVVACVRVRDIIRYLVQHCARHVLNLPPDPEQVARTREGG